MNSVVGSEGITMRCGRDCGRLRAVRSAYRAFCASCEVTFGVQDALRAATHRSDLLAITRLASPKRVNSCASFLARPSCCRIA